MSDFLRGVLGRFGLQRIGIGVSFALPSFMKPSGASDFNEDEVKDLTVSRQLKHCHPELIKRFSRLSTAYVERNPGRMLQITCSYRSPQEQWRLYGIGRTAPGKIVTNCDGRSKLSEHNKFPARAVDVCVLEGGKVLWGEEYYWPLLGLAKEFDLESGGSWASFQDWPHIQLPRNAG